MSRIESNSNITIQKTVTRIIMIFFSFVLTIMIFLTFVLLIMSPGKPKPFLDINGNVLPFSISEKIFVEINGVEQGMFIMGKNINNPVLLYLHGGLPDYLLKQEYPTDLENDFTVVWWEQRGSGMSYNDNLPNGSITQEQMISDTIAVTNYLRHRFGQDKIYLMGHSGGTFIGIQTAAMAPELYKAYIGVAQISDQYKSEVLAYDYMLQQFTAIENQKMVQKMEAAPVSMESGIPDGYRVIRDTAMHSLGIGTTHNMKSIFTGIFFPSLTCKEYTLSEKFNLWRGKARSGISNMWTSIISTDMNQKVPELEIPVYFFSGVYDYTVSYSLAKEYFEILKAPVKGFYTFENSAHSPLFEEPEKMEQIIQQDVLKGLTTLADN